MIRFGCSILIIALLFASNLAAQATLRDELSSYLTAPSQNTAPDTLTPLASTPNSSTSLPCPSGVISVDWSPDGSKIVGGGTDGLLQIWDAVSGTILQTLTGHSGTVISVRWSPDGTQIISSGEDKIVRVWDGNTRRPLAQLQGHESLILAVAWSPDGSQFASVGWGGGQNLKIWNATTYTIMNTPSVGDSYGVAWKSDGTKIALATTGVGAFIINSNFDGKLQTSDRIGGYKPASSIAWKSDGTQLALGGYNDYSENETKVYILNPTTGTEIATLSGHTGEISVVSWSPDDTRLATVGQDDVIRFWNTNDWTLITTISLDYSVVRAVAWSPDGTQIAYGGPDGTIHIEAAPQISSSHN